MSNDLLEIRCLLDKYTQTINLRDWAGLGELFADDGIWDVRGVHSPNPLFEGNAAVVSGVVAAVSKYVMLIQMNHAPVIEVAGDRASAYSTINEVGVLNDEHGLFLLGTYKDDIRKINNRWQFKIRIFQAAYIDRKPLTGQVLVSGAAWPEH